MACLDAGHAVDRGPGLVFRPDRGESGGGVLYHYFYTSRALSPFPGIVDFDILRAAWAYNQANGIGGYLLRTRDTYFQWLEGPKTQLDSLMARIGRDPRHEDVAILLEGPLAARNFANWVMGYHELTEEETGRLAAPGAQTPPTDAVLDLLREKARLRLG